MPKKKPAPKAATPREARRDRRRDQSRDEILVAARKVLLEKGIAGTTLEAVAKEIGVTKAALYYYYPSKDALFFELMFAAHFRHANAVHDSVELTDNGGDALRAVIRETVEVYSKHLEDFRLAYLHGQVAAPGAVKLDAAQFARLRPLNDLTYAGTAKRLTKDGKQRPARAGVDPRMMTFLAQMAAVGLLTFKGMVESFGDPLRYSDDELIDSLARIFEAAAAP
jgi:AcrR family transcriptional regulator